MITDHCKFKDSVNYVFSFCNFNLLILNSNFKTMIVFLVLLPVVSACGVLFSHTLCVSVSALYEKSEMTSTETNVTEGRRRGTRVSWSNEIQRTISSWDVLWSLGSLLSRVVLLVLMFPMYSVTYAICQCVAYFSTPQVSSYVRSKEGRGKLLRAVITCVMMMASCFITPNHMGNNDGQWYVLLVYIGFTYLLLNLLRLWTFPLTILHRGCAPSRYGHADWSSRIQAFALQDSSEQFREECEEIYSVATWLAAPLFVVFVCCGVNILHQRS